MLIETGDLKSLPSIRSSLCDSLNFTILCCICARSVFYMLLKVRLLAWCSLCSDLDVSDTLSLLELILLWMHILPPYILHILLLLAFNIFCFIWWLLLLLFSIKTFSNIKINFYYWLIFILNNAFLA